MKVAVLLANGFETLEALTVVDILRRGEVECNTFSLEGNEVTTSHNIKLKADKSIMDEEINSYDFLVLPGGMPGSINLRDDERVIELVKKFNEKNKWVCAICAGPIVLGKAGITEGKNVTCYPGFEEELGNCNYKNDMVVVDGNIITGRGPAAAIPFAFEILSKISEEKAEKIKKAMLFK
ncbi:MULTISPECIES: DJ-1 family glyoxalase III [unclassified Clostridium]|jgi:protein deglycase|uniref:DJ-1 family glyoxalase III n=1 Tax=unclassified Clostridium TaxID=2614128 RepID=UPI0025BA25B5|nr:DJ-1 family glyoxalase III [Clostridium sp.]MCI6691433.1 DJ-1/PfpI family protein [Clostridium sp.]MDY2630280.1 DJ-1 family glyoxalase III [Clostridium sp.]MDY4252192.1 DJ-1 family glyoxalase III [Clostridium sp.]